MALRKNNPDIQSIFISDAEILSGIASFMKVNMQQKVEDKHLEKYVYFSQCCL